MDHPLSGTGVALVTPFTKEEEIDYSALEKLLAMLAEKGADYLVVMGTTGESATIDFNDKRKVLSFVKDHADGLPVVYGHGSNSTRRMIEELDELDLSGVDALLSVSPYYNKPPQEGIYQHYMALADASPVPVILYNVPGRTASNILPITVSRLSEHEKIIGIKEAAGSMEQALNIRKLTDPDFLLISGDDMLTVPIYSIGGSGVISVLANALPGIFTKMKSHVLSGNYSEATEEANLLTEINPLMYEEANPVGLKALLNLMGICSTHVRLPLVEASNSLITRINNAYHKIPRHYR
jgi:4-hydroxy-tetrahydrodipicolinate synthase